MIVFIHYLIFLSVLYYSRMLLPLNFVVTFFKSQQKTLFLANNFIICRILRVIAPSVQAAIIYMLNLNLS